MPQMREAFPWDEAPRYLLRDRDAIYGRNFADLTRDMRDRCVELCTIILPTISDHVRI